MSPSSSSSSSEGSFNSSILSFNDSDKKLSDSFTLSVNSLSGVKFTTNSSKGLSELIDTELRTPVSRGALAITNVLKTRYGDAVLGILYYGSCFRSGVEKDGILDMFVIVDDYRNIYRESTLAIANKLLPPNVFYCESDFEGDTLRTKYAIITLDQFTHRCSSECFHTFFYHLDKSSRHHLL